MPQTPISIHIPPSLQKYAIPLSKFLETHPRCATLAVGAFIFAPSSLHVSSPAIPRLLLIRRAAAERSFPNLWEIPGGGAEPSDPTIIHSVAREVFEETGLHLQRVVRQVGDTEEFMVGSKDGPKPCLKLNFEIEVQEIGNPLSASASESQPADGLCDGANDQVGHGEALAGPALHGLGSINVVVDPVEHQAFRWVSEQDVMDATCLLHGAETDGETLTKKRTGLPEDASGALKLVSRNQQRLMLEAFSVHDQ